MYRKYLFRSNFKGVYEQEGEKLAAHIAFKTQDVSWLNISCPVLVLISVNSAFHERGEGFLKMEALLSTIQSCVKGEVHILIADLAHLHAQSLLDGPGAKESCLRAGKELVFRYRSLFEGSELIYWHALCHNTAYTQIKSDVWTLFHSDETFQKYLFEDAEVAFTEKRAREFTDKEQFIEKTITDLIEQCICLQLLACRGYRHLFYPGAPCRATEYLNTILSSQLKWIDVFLSIERKTRMLLPA